MRHAVEDIRRSTRTIHSEISRARKESRRSARSIHSGIESLQMLVTAPIIYKLCTSPHQRFIS